MTVPKPTRVCSACGQDLDADPTECLVPGVAHTPTTPDPAARIAQVRHRAEVLEAVGFADEHLEEWARELVADRRR